MSLHDAIQAIVEDMEEVAGSPPHSNESLQLRSYARMLRIALKAATAGSMMGVNAQPVILPAYPDPITQHATEIEKARAEFRNKKKPNEDTDRMVLLVGGSGDGALLPFPEAAPVGARTEVSGDVYELWSDGSLHYVRPQRTKAEVLRARNTRSGCCNRYADNMACDCLEGAV